MIRHFFLCGLSAAALLAVNMSACAAGTNASPAKASVLEGVTYLRVSRVAADLTDELAAANPVVTATNKIFGMILDLRFAEGSDATPIKQAAEFFTAKKTPLAILVNAETRGAAATLAATLREQKAGLVFGSATTGVKPDIEVKVSAADERAYFADAYAKLAQTNLPTEAGLSTTNQVAATNQPPRRRVSEADLVEARRKGAADPEEALDNSPAPPVLPEKPVVRDPVLARALDFLKSLALVRGLHGG